MSKQRNKKPNVIKKALADTLATSTATAITIGYALLSKDRVRMSRYSPYPS
jgi:hypothetical protein